MFLRSCAVVFACVGVAFGGEPLLRRPHFSPVKTSKGTLSSDKLHPDEAVVPIHHGDAPKETPKNGVASAKGHEKDQKGEGVVGHEKEHKGEGDHAGKLFAIGMIGTVVLMMIIMDMCVSDNLLVKNYTICAVDNVVAIFLAVVFFQAYDDILVRIFPGSHAWAASLHAIALLVIVFGTSWCLRNSAKGLAIFCAASAHYVSFVSMHSAKTVMSHHFSKELILFFIGLVVMIVLVAAAFWLLNFGRKTFRMEHEKWEDRIDDVANDCGAMAVAVCGTLLVRACIAGRYHDIAAHAGEEEQHTFRDRMAMLIYAMCLTPFAGFLLHLLSSAKSRIPEDNSGYWKKRAIMFAISVLSMSVAWAWLLWGEWQFGARAELEHHPEITAKVYFAVCCTFATAGIIVALGNIKLSGAMRTTFKHTRGVVLMSLSLLVGWSWEEAFDAAIESGIDGYAEPAHVKMIVAAALACVIVPVYWRSLKPLAMKADEELEEHENRKSRPVDKDSGDNSDVKVDA